MALEKFVRRTLLRAPCAAAFLLLAGAASGDPTGTWRGNSICQIRPSPCNDETSSYQIALGANGHYRIAMSKLVGTVYEEFGSLDATFDPATSTLSATTYDRQRRPGQWRFTLSGNRLDGTLVTSDGKLYRRIALTRIGG
jgi:hypothetical protein